MQNPERIRNRPMPNTAAINTSRLCRTRSLRKVGITSIASANYMIVMKQYTRIILRL